MTITREQFNNLPWEYEIGEYVYLVTATHDIHHTPKRHRIFARMLVVSAGSDKDEAPCSGYLLHSVGQIYFANSFTRVIPPFNDDPELRKAMQARLEISPGILWQLVD